MKVRSLPTYKDFEENPTTSITGIPTFEQFEEQKEAVDQETSLTDSEKADMEEAVRIFNEEMGSDERSDVLETIDEMVKENKSRQDLLMELNEGNIGESALGQVLGGLSGAAFGKTVGKMIADTLGIEKGLLYDLLTSKVVASAIGSKIGGRFF